MEYTWKITGLKTKDVSEVRPDTVVQTDWTKTGMDENGNTGTFSGATPFTVDPTDDSGTFVPFNELTEQNILDWIKTIVVGDYEKHVNAQIQKQINDKIVVVKDMPLPWEPIPEAPAPETVSPTPSGTTSENTPEE